MVAETNFIKFSKYFYTDTFTPADTVPPSHLKDIITTIAKFEYPKDIRFSVLLT